VGVAVEIRGEGSGGLRLDVLPNASGDAPGSFVAASIMAGATGAHRSLAPPTAQITQTE
jgi:hypothetical protein